MNDVWYSPQLDLELMHVTTSKVEQIISLLIKLKKKLIINYLMIFFIFFLFNSFLIIYLSDLEKIASVVYLVAALRMNAT